jgi:hypothetical protein
MLYECLNIKSDINQFVFFFDAQKRMKIQHLTKNMLVSLDRRQKL